MRTLYDNIGNIVTKATEHGTYGYDYDASSRLTDVDNPVLDDESYTYDNVGNRLTSADVSGTWNYNENNELLGFADVEYTYDENGNMTQITVAGAVVWTYVYDAANRLVHVEDGTGTISADYYYDPFGRRLWKDVGGTKTYFFYSDEGLIGEYDASGNEIKTYGYKPDSTWTSNPLFMKQGTEYYFYQNDHLGTPQKLVGVNGAVVWSATYSAFGKATVEVETVTNNLRFPGQYADVETGLHYNYFRYYEPKIGRYLRTDPLGFAGGSVNWYKYARNNPINIDDPLGLSDYYDIKEEDKGGTLIYSCKCGWIDWSHAFPESVRGLWWGDRGIWPPDENIVESKQGGGFRVRYTVRQYEDLSDNVRVIARYARSYFVNVRCTYTHEQQKAIALVIFQETQEGFERKLQGNIWYRRGAYIGILGLHKLDKSVASSLSEEDLPSDWIAFYMAVKKYSQDDIKELCDPVSVEESRAVYRRLYGKDGKLRKNPKWKPLNHNFAAPSCCDPGTGYLEWPEEGDYSLRDITPIPKGTCWRDWTKCDYQHLFNWDALFSEEEYLRNQTEYLDLLKIEFRIGDEWYL